MMDVTRHPLQRLASPGRAFSLALHIAGLASFAASFRYLWLWPTVVDEQYGWHWQFLTIIGLSLSTVCFSFGLLADLFLSRRLFAVKNALAVPAAPLEVLISMLYWGISAINKNLVAPPDFSLSLGADVGFHLIPAVVMTLDLLLLSPPWTIRGYSFMAMSTGFAFGYWYWIEWCFDRNGSYPYPIFALLDTTERALLFIFSAGLMTLSTVPLKWMYGRINGIEKMEREAHKPLVKSG